MKIIRPGDVFKLVTGTGLMQVVTTFRREADDPAPRWECERIRVTHLASSVLPSLRPYTFGTEPEWFTQRGLVAA